MRRITALLGRKASLPSPWWGPALRSGEDIGLRSDRERLAGHDVVLAEGVEVARGCFGMGKFGVALVDFDLDDGKGSELGAGLRRDGHRIRIIGVSAHEAGNAALLAAGADATCAKARFATIATLLARDR